MPFHSETEVGNVGFGIYRSESEDGNYTKIAFLPGAGSSAMPNDYQFTDKKVEEGKLEYAYQRPSLPSKHRELKDGSILVNIEGQEFFFGPQQEPRKVDTFAISIYPVQNWQYYNFLKENYRVFSHPSTEDELHHLWPSAWGLSYPEQKANHPVTGIEPPAIRKYLSWVYEGVVMLPIEDEWVLAAYGPHSWLYPWGDYFDVSKCNVYESGHSNTTPVDFYKDGVSYFGCYDMAGNCFEFIESKLNPIEHIVRGGSYLLDHTYASCLIRKGNAPLNRELDLGFRIVTHGMIF